MECLTHAFGLNVLRMTLALADVRDYTSARLEFPSIVEVPHLLAVELDGFAPISLIKIAHPHRGRPLTNPLGGELVCSAVRSTASFIMAQALPDPSKKDEDTPYLILCVQYSNPVDQALIQGKDIHTS